MQAYLTLVRRELGSFFKSWTGYIIITGVGCAFRPFNMLEKLNPSRNITPAMMM